MDRFARVEWWLNKDFKSVFVVRPTKPASTAQGLFQGGSRTVAQHAQHSQTFEVECRKHILRISNGKKKRVKHFQKTEKKMIILFDFNGMSTSLRLFYA